MANSRKITVTLTDDHIKLISNIHFGEPPVIEENDTRHYINYCIDMNNLYGGSFLFEDISFILGIYERRLSHTEDEPTGVRFNKEDEDYMFELHSYIVENIEYIEEIIHQFCGNGGIKAGTYSCDKYNRIWNLE